MILNFIKGFFGIIFIFSAIVALILGAFIIALILFIIGILLFPKFKKEVFVNDNVFNDDTPNTKNKTTLSSKTQKKENEIIDNIQKRINAFELSDKSKEKGVFYKLNFLKEFVPSYRLKHLNDNYYFNEYTRVDGDWINENEIVAYVSSSSYNKPILSPKSGYLEHILKQGDLLQDGQSIAKIHNEGEYSKQNSIKNSNYYHYCKINKIPEYSIKWLVDDGKFVHKDQTIYSVNGYFSGDFTQKAEKNGYIDINRLKEFNDYNLKDLIYAIRDNDQIRIENKYQNIPNIIYDDFTKTKSIKWKKVSTIYSNSKSITTYSDDMQIELLFTLNYINNNDYIVFYLNPKQINTKIIDKISFLFENNKIITFNINSKPLLNKLPNNKLEIEIKSLITKEEIELFYKENMEKWKIQLENGNKEILGGNIGLEKNYFSKSNLNIVIKKFAKEYSEIVKNEINDYKPLIFHTENKLDINNDEKCYVYLMKDTTNSFFKIGISNNPNYREKTLQSEKPTIELIIAKEYPIRKIAESFEKALHNTYSEKRIRGEWFKLNDDDVKNIKKALM